MYKLLLLVVSVSGAPYPVEVDPYGPPPAYSKNVPPPPEYKPAPIQYKPIPPAPAPYKPAPAPYKPAPAQYKPEPEQYRPAPKPYKPTAYVEEEEDLSPKPYSYNFGVQNDYSNTAFGKKEEQDEKGVVRGQYK